MLLSLRSDVLFLQRVPLCNTQRLRVVSPPCEPRAGYSKIQEILAEGLKL